MACQAGDLVQTNDRICGTLISEYNLNAIAESSKRHIQMRLIVFEVFERLSASGNNRFLEFSGDRAG